MTARLALICAGLALALSACLGGATLASHAGAKSQYPYAILLQNNSPTAVSVLGCPDCGSGHQLATGQQWITRIDGFTTLDFRDGSGRVVGCVHISDGLTPPKGAPPETIKVASEMPCPNSVEDQAPARSVRE